ncbi:MAG TPA: hypothetical protein PLW44_09995, partial [Chitinophagales bacterium]|nr:hypothetical protein [Chitinophagales bacterium]
MASSLSFQYPAWFLVLCLLAGATYAAVLYYRDTTFDEKTSGSKWWQYAMATFRFVTVTVLAVLLLSPFIRTRNTKQFKPVVAVINDNSESVKAGLKADTTAYKQQLEKLINKLGDKYEVVPYNAGDVLKRGVDFSYTDKATDLSGALDEINSIYYNLNLGAVVIASDGIYNKGVNPVYTAAKAGYSVYTIALGDTTIQKDQKLSNAYYNKITYLNDQFALRVDVEQTNLPGKNVKLSVYEVGEGNNATLLQGKDIVYTSDNFFQSYDFVLPASRVGIMHYRIALSNVEGEVTYRNNVRDIFVEVLDGRQKILLVAQSPHPDIAAFKAA